MRVWALSTVQTGLDVVELLLDEQVRIDGVIGLSERAPSDAISGFTDTAAWCAARDIEFVPVESYALDDAGDRARLGSLDLDVLLVVGWQRLVPTWLMSRGVALGMHGSPFGITGGRGRSPQTWAIIMGAREFHLSLFHLRDGIDSGAVIETTSFELTDRDDIATSNKLVAAAAARMIADALRDGIPAGTAQDDGDARYLPRRLPEDGEIDWSRSSIEIDRFVRAQTRPYPGAFARAGASVVKIWRARPFPATLAAEPGTIVAEFADDTFLVATGDGALRVEDHTGDVVRGARFEACDFTAQMRTIVERHRARYPDLPLAEGILRLAGE